MLILDVTQFIFLINDFLNVVCIVKPFFVVDKITSLSAVCCKHIFNKLYLNDYMTIPVHHMKYVSFADIF